MRNVMWTRVLALSFLFLTIYILLPFNSFSLTAQSQFSPPSLERTEWRVNTKDLSLEVFYVFGKQGKVGWTASTLYFSGVNPPRLYYDNNLGWQSDPGDLTKYMAIKVDKNLDGTYSQKCNSIRIEFNDHFIDAIVNGNSMEGEITSKVSDYKAKWSAVKTSKSSEVSNNMSQPRAEIQSIWVDHNVHDNETKGMRIHIKFTIHNSKDEECMAVAHFYSDSGALLKDFNGQYNSADGYVAVGTNFTPVHTGTIFEDFQLFMPIDELHLDKGIYNLKFVIKLYRKDIGFFAESCDQYFKYSR